MNTVDPTKEIIPTPYTPLDHQKNVNSVEVIQESDRFQQHK